MASVQTGRDLPEAKWKECDVVGCLELLFQVATVKDLFLIIAVWNTTIKDVQKADAAGWLFWLLLGCFHQPGCTRWVLLSRQAESKKTLPGDLIAGQLF